MKADETYEQLIRNQQVVRSSRIIGSSLPSPSELPDLSAPLKRKIAERQRSVATKSSVEREGVHHVALADPFGLLWELLPDPF